MRSKRPAIALLMSAACVSALAACSTDLGPTQAELHAQWDAQNVFPQNYKSDLLAFMRSYLNNPEGVRGASVSAPVLMRIGPGDRYVACVRYSARDMVGKYGPTKEGAAVYAAAKLERYVDQPREVKELCKTAVYAPFPELQALKR